MEARHGLRHREARGRAQGPAEPGGHAAHGYTLPDDILGEDEIHRLELALNDRVKAGFHLHEQWNVKADTLVDGLGAKVRAMGVDVLEGAEAIEFDRTQAWSGRFAPAGDIAADQFVLGGGSWTTRLTGRGRPDPDGAGEVGTVPLTPKVMPRHGLILADIHAGLTSVGDRVRIGGTMEPRHDLSIDRRRIDSLRATRAATSTSTSRAYEELWVGCVR